MKSDEERWAEFEQWQRMAGKSAAQFITGCVKGGAIIAAVFMAPIALVLLHTPLAPFVVVPVVVWLLMRHQKAKDADTQYAWCNTCQAVAPVEHTHKGGRS